MGRVIIRKRRGEERRGEERRGEERRGEERRGEKRGITGGIFLSMELALVLFAVLLGRESLVTIYLGIFKQFKISFIFR